MIISDVLSNLVMEPEKCLAPIILLVYNRPDHTRKTLESLMANDLASQSTLFIYADGPKPGASVEQLENLKKTRKVIREKKWCGEVRIFESEENLGVDNATIKHVTEIINKFGKVIVLEDDIVTSKGFLTYMNDALNLYEGEEKVLSISGYMFPIKEKLPDTVLLKGLTGNWGWATWKRAWSHFNPNYKLLADNIAYNQKFVEAFNVENSFDYFNMLVDSTEEHKPWDIRWYASVFLRGGYCLWPGNSLVQNIGHDASGTHCGESQDFYINELAQSIKLTPLPVQENIKARKAISKFNKSINQQGLLIRIKWKLSHGLKGIKKLLEF